MIDCLVAGGGLAGSAAAIALARAGREVTLIERETAPHHKVCGEFLSIEAQGYLRALGLNPASLGGHEITQVCLVRKADVISAPLPFTAMGLTRRRIDEALLGLAARAGVNVRRGHSIRAVNPAALKVDVDDLGCLCPRTLLLATGKHDVRAAPRAHAPSVYVGFKTYFRLAPGQRAALAGRVELILYPGGYAGLQLVEDGMANLCLLITAAALKRAGGQWEAVLDMIQAASPHLATRLAGGQALLAKPLAIARIPYGFVHHASLEDHPGLFRIGDQAAVIPSFTGDGMSISLHSAALAASYAARNASAHAYHRRLSADIARPMRMAGALHGLLAAGASYNAVFALARLVPASLALGAALTRIPLGQRLIPGY